MKEEWVDPDDAPEADEEWFRNAHVYIGDTLIKRAVSRPLIKNAQEMLSLCFFATFCTLSLRRQDGWI